MLTEIYYFSGTGNSLAVARKIKNALTDKAEIIVIPKTSFGTATMADRIMSYLVHDGIDKEKWALYLSARTKPQQEYRSTPG